MTATPEVDRAHIQPKITLRDMEMFTAELLYRCAPCPENGERNTILCILPREHETLEAMHRTFQLLVNHEPAVRDAISRRRR